MHTIDRVELYLARLPLRHAFESSLKRESEIRHILVRLVDADGAEGWGEVAAMADLSYGGETIETCWIVLRDHFAPAILAAPWETPADARKLLAPLRGYNAARAGIEMACWDLWARARGESVAAALGGVRDAIPAGVSLGIEPTIEGLLDEVEKHLDAGYGDVKMKIRPGWDVEPVTAVRERHPDLAIRLDANGSYESLRDLPIFKELEELQVTMLEQPFGPDELMLHARLQERIRTPICIDESAVSTGIIRAAISLGSCRAIAVKIARLGGIGPAREIHDLAEAAGIAVVCGGMLEFGIGRAANVAVSSLPGFRHAGDIAGSDHSFAEDLVEPPVLAADGMIPVPLDRPGLGVRVDEARLAAATVRTHFVTRNA